MVVYVSLNYNRADFIDYTPRGLLSLVFIKRASQCDDLKNRVLDDGSVLALQRGTLMVIQAEVAISCCHLKTLNKIMICEVVRFTKYRDFNEELQVTRTKQPAFYLQK